MITGSYISTINPHRVNAKKDFSKTQVLLKPFFVPLISFLD